MALVGHYELRSYGGADEQAEDWDDQTDSGNNDERFTHRPVLELFRSAE